MSIFSLFKKSKDAPSRLIDEFTGISNWRVLLQRLDGLTARGQSKPFVLTLIGLDRFAFMNLLHGPPATDEALRLVAQALVAHAQPRETVVRVRSDIFAVLCVEQTDEQAAQRAEEMRLLCIDRLKPYDTTTMRNEVAEQSAMVVSLARREGRTPPLPHSVEAPVLTATAVLLRLQPDSWAGTSTQLMERSLDLLAMGKAVGKDRLWLQSELELREQPREWKTSSAKTQSANDASSQSSPEAAAQNRIQATRMLIGALEYAVDYENNMEASLKDGPGLAPYPYQPAARDAYQRMLAVLDRTELGSADLDAVHAALQSVFAQPHYHGIQLCDITMRVDSWLAAMDERNARPSLYQVYRDMAMR